MLLLVMAGTAHLGAQERPTLTEDDYGKWERLGPATISPDGSWLAVLISRVNDEDELRIHRTDSDSVIVVPYGARPAFSDDSRWLAYAIGVSEEEREAARERDRPVRDKLGLLDLETGERTVREEVASFAFSDDGRYLAMRRYKPEEKESAGVDVIVRDLADGTQMLFGNVSEMAWQDEGTLLALAIDADDQIGNGVSLYDPSTGRVQVLETEEATYRELTWREEADDLVVYRTRVDEAFEDTAHVVLAWTGLEGDRPGERVLDPQENAAFPATMRVVEHRSPRWSDDGTTVFVGIQERRPKPDDPCAPEDGDPAQETGTEGRGGGEPEGDQEGGDEEDGSAPECDDEEEAPGVEIWHTLDVDPVPQQRVRERRLRQENHLAAWHVEDGGFVQLGDELTEETFLVADGASVVGFDETPYDEHAMFRQQFADLYVIDPRTGGKTLVEDRIPGLGGLSPEGGYVLWFEGEDWFAHDLEAGVTRNITEDVPSVFVNLDVTPTREQMPPFGTGGWVEGDRAVLLNDEWDVWEVSPDGSGARRLTDGAEEEVRYRVTPMDRDGEDDGFGPEERLYYTVYGEWTKKAGYAAAERGDEPETLVWDDKSFGGFFGRLQKAEDADVFVFRQEAYDDSPDYFVAGPDLEDPRQVTDTNPFQEDYAWGRTELVDYENEWGRRLQGVLTYPADYQPGRSYPMIVYQYELLSQGMHQYQVPDPTRYYNQQIWAQSGYFVFRPDIVYRDRRPGQSNVETIRPAVAAALSHEPDIDEEALGLIGHSWGGYQTTYFVTQDDLFAAAVAGAPLTNLMSMYLSFYWNSGGTDARIFEISQGRMQVPWWEDYASYEANSPVHHIQNMETPLLMMFGTNDGAVEYNQGVEFYNAARRLGKEMVLLSYEGENHGLAQEPNQLDYQRRIMEWFGHYLKGEPAPDWIESGLPYIEQQDRLERRRPVG
ncbi:MAG: prolyl oligopeptidase family serine peptidase [Longimicrobiales bacterium]|nr:prolyl oligopeptidase family serine peptidase [Longimicrobiales bacterium]